MKPKPDFEEVIGQIQAGETFRKIAEGHGMPLSTLFDWLHKPEHSARVREALELSAESYADKGEEVLLNAKSNLTEVTRARELSQFYRWKASKRSPKKYGDKLELDHSGQIDSKITVEVIETGTPIAGNESEVKT